MFAHICGECWGYRTIGLFTVGILLHPGLHVYYLIAEIKSLHKLLLIFNVSVEFTVSGIISVCAHVVLCNLSWVIYIPEKSVDDGWWIGYLVLAMYLMMIVTCSSLKPKKVWSFHYKSWRRNVGRKIVIIFQGDVMGLSSWHSLVVHCLVHACCLNGGGGPINLLCGHLSFHGRSLLSQMWPFVDDWCCLGLSLCQPLNPGSPFNRVNRVLFVGGWSNVNAAGTIIRF